jgi:aminoglycoside phosphotransferase (APT) family kinase protein
MRLNESRLTQCIRRHLPHVDGAISFERVPTGKFNDSFFVHSGAEDFVIRIAPPKDSVFVFYERDMMRQEPGIHELLLKKTSVPVARILAFDDSHEIIDRDYMIMERLPGTALTHAPRVDEDKVLGTVGRCLAEVHRLTANRYGYLGEHAPMEPQPTWPRAFEIMWRKLVEDVRASGHYSEAESDRLLSLLEQHLPLFDRDVPASLLHMDIWAQNVLVDEEGNLTGLVDWDRALWGDPEIEFAVLDYCTVSKPAFWKGYGRERDESPDAQTRNIFYLLYEIQKYIVIREGRENDSEGARWYQRHVMQIVNRHFA